MSDPKRPAKTPITDEGRQAIQAMFDEAAEKGYFGETPDDTDRDEYTLKAVGKKVPNAKTNSVITRDKLGGAKPTEK